MTASIRGNNSFVTGDNFLSIFRHERVIALYETRSKRIVSLIFALALILSLSLTPAWADEERTLIPVGKAVGIKLFADGALVVGIEGSETLQTGDFLLRLNGEKVTSTEQLQALLQCCGEAPLTLEVRRGSKLLTLQSQARRGEDGVYRLGAWVRDSMAGIGTLTFYDPLTAQYGALGHGITDVDTAQLMSLQGGSIMETTVKAVKKGEKGDPGELKGDFSVQRDVGTLCANTCGGIFGTVADPDFIDASRALPVADADQVKCGRATILSTVNGDQTQEYTVEILRLYGAGSDTKNLLLQVTDPRLLSATGGIVQGMSGSPILQDGRLVGAVTHVLVNDPTRGYGIFMENMLSMAG